MAKWERQIHRTAYPNWSAKDNYARTRKLKRLSESEQRSQRQSMDRLEPVWPCPEGLVLRVMGSGFSVGLGRGLFRPAALEKRSFNSRPYAFECHL